MNFWKYLIAGTTLALVVSVSVRAQTASNPVLGTWKLNLAKSKFDPGPVPKGDTRMYEATPDGTKITVHTQTASGETRWETTFKPDGKPHPIIGNPYVDAIAVRPVSDLASKGDLMRSGKIVGHYSRTLSKDHNTLSLDETLTTAGGTMEHDIEVFDRQ